VAKQKENGMAFEWAVGKAIANTTQFQIIEDKFSRIPRLCYEEKISNKKRQIFDLAALISVQHILSKEAVENWDKSTSVIQFNNDAAGQKGDVRDLIIKNNRKELGISCKANHEALKHPRLSGRLDFIKKWGLSDGGCIPEYWNTIKPIFSELSTIKKSSKGTATWEDLVDKAERFYWPILDAWESEIKRTVAVSTDTEAQICKNFITYLIGRHDFYKIICRGSDRVDLQAFNFSGLLATRQTKFPTVINLINNKNGGIYSKTIVFNHGFSINFRIHSASSKVESSLKFDINAIGLPTGDVYQQTFDL
jgi:HaeIII restriction endonuclease